MFNSNGGYSIADIAAVTGNRGSESWGAGDGAWWIIILFLFVFCGWGNGGWSNGGGSAMQGALTRADLCQDMNFADVQGGVRAISEGMNTNFANLNSTICHQEYETARMIDALNVSNLQSANAQNIAAMQNQNALQTQIAQCCCENREGQAQIRYDMATNTCALNNTIQTSTRDIIDSQNAGTRAILDYLCQEKIADLQAENQGLRLAASQAAQNQYLVNQLRPFPVAAYSVPNPFTGAYGIQGYNSCGCGCGSTGFIG